MAPCDAQARIRELEAACDKLMADNAEYAKRHVDQLGRITQLEAVNAAMRERDIRLTERRAALLLENQQLQMEVDLHKRAVEWLTYNSPVRCFDGKFRRGVCTDTFIEVPAELAEIIRSQP